MTAVKDIMKKDFSTLSSLDSVETAIEVMNKKKVDYLIAEEAGRIKGVITSHSLAGYPPSRLLIDCIIEPIDNILEKAPLEQALKTLEEKKVGFLVISNNEGKPVGIANREMVISSICQELSNLNEEMRKHIARRKKIEEELKKKVHDLETFHKVAVGRELKMKELKTRIAQLEEQIRSKP